MTMSSRTDADDPERTLASGRGQVVWVDRPNGRSEPELTDREEAAIQAGIGADPDNPEVTAERFARMRPASDVLPPALYAALTKARGRPKSENPKVPVKLRLDSATLKAFKATGAGWQTRMNDVLARAAKRLPVR